MMLTGFLIQEAIHSVAIEHADDCQCDICKAANGDQDALARVWVAVADAQRAREEDR